MFECYGRSDVLISGAWTDVCGVEAEQVVISEMIKFEGYFQKTSSCPRNAHSMVYLGTLCQGPIRVHLQ